MDIVNLPKTRAEAIRLKATHYFTGMPCKHGHVAPRKTKGACIDCLRVEWRESATKRSDYFTTYNARVEVRQKKHAWYEANREQVIAAAALIPVEQTRAYKRQWKTKNKTWVRADTKARRRKHREASPPWLTAGHKAEIRQLYQSAIESSRISGEKYVVDHIIPLRSDVVCGLHVPWNLRIITRIQNAAKSNAMPDDSEAVAFPQGRCYNGRT